MKSVDYDVIIIGAGFAGIGLAIQLQKTGLGSFLVLEKNADVGGTWYENTYPGAACDVASHFYSFSFAPNPNWTRTYSPQVEIEEYLQNCVAKYDIRQNIRFNTAMTSAQYDSDAAIWNVQTACGDTLSARFLVSGIGAFNHPFTPDIEGQDNFQGAQMHSARWDSKVDLQGKKVAVIGSAASAIQIIPAIASTVKELRVFQRTPNYIISRRDRKYSSFEKFLFRYLPGFMKSRRYYIFLRMEKNFLAFREGTWFRIFPKICFWLNIRRGISDPELMDKLTPDYPAGCKRVLLSDDYYPTLQRDHVHLVTSGLDKITSNSIVSKDGQNHSVDVIIYATGFQVTGTFYKFDVTGRTRSLGQAWEKTPEAYLGITVPEFPNFFMMLGPNTGLGHNSIVFMIENQIRYILCCLRKLKKENKQSIEVSKEPHDAFNKRLQNAMSNKVWLASCPSWYKDSEGKVTTLWPYTTLRYWYETIKPRWQDYTIQ